MPTRAYVLIHAEIGRGNDILATVRGLPQIIYADRVTGPYDVICVLEAESLNEVGDIVRDRIHPIPGIARTMSCVSFTTVTGKR